MLLLKSWSHPEMHVRDSCNYTVSNIDLNELFELRKLTVFSHRLLYKQDVTKRKDLKTDGFL